MNSFDWDKIKEKKPFNEKPKKGKFLEWVGIILMVIGACGTIFFMVKIFRSVSYTIKYKSQVQKQIIEMVKPEALKDKYKGM